MIRVKRTNTSLFKVIVMSGLIGCSIGLVVIFTFAAIYGSFPIKEANPIILYSEIAIVLVLMVSGGYYFIKEIRGKLV